MHKAVKIAVAALVVLAGPVCGEEGDASTAPASASTASVGIAGYHPVSDVKSHSEIDKDLKDIAGLGSNWAEAKKIYEEGKNSGSRSLQGFSTKFKNKASMQAEPMAVLVNNYWKRYDYADAVISAALSGEDVDRLGTYKSGVLASTADARKQMVKKGLLSSTWMYALHEVESALAKYEGGNLDLHKGAAHALDEGWAFYAGSLEQGDKSGQLAYTLGEKFGPYFATYGYEMGTGGGSRVNLEMLYHFTAMERYIQQPGNSEALKDAAKCVRAQSKVPFIQGCLKYTHQAWSKDMTDDAKLAKIKAEAWAFCITALPFLHEADPAAAAAVEKETSLSNAERPNWTVVKEAFSRQNLNKMGLLCQDVGILGGNDAGDAYKGTYAPFVSGDEHLKWCKDDLSLVEANAYADSSKCKYTRMPKCKGDIVCKD